MMISHIFHCRHHRFTCPAPFMLSHTEIGFYLFLSLFAVFLWCLPRDLPSQSVVIDTALPSVKDCTTQQAAVSKEAVVWRSCNFTSLLTLDFNDVLSAVRSLLCSCYLQSSTANPVDRDEEMCCLLLTCIIFDP